MPLGVQRTSMVAQLAKGIGFKFGRSGIDFHFSFSFSIDCNKAIALFIQYVKRLFDRLIDCN